MPTNKYFTQYAFGREQDLVEDLIIESIKQTGYNLKYIPRTIVRNDPLFGEDTLSKFDEAIGIEMYIKSVEGFEGQGDFLSKFNLQIDDQITFTVAKKRFDQARTAKLTTEVGYNYLLESASTTTPSRQRLSEDGSTDSIVLDMEDGYNITSNRPMEGDLIFEPFSRKLFEIKFVEHEAVFYQLGRLQTYDVRCEIFNYSSEDLATGDAYIDSIEDKYSTDILFHEILMETGEKLLLEQGGSYILEFRIEDTQPTANNEYYSSGDPIFSPSSVIDFSESNPFSEIDRY